MSDRIFAVLVLMLILTASYVISENQTEENKIKSYEFMMRKF